MRCGLFLGLPAVALWICIIGRSVGSAKILKRVIKKKAFNLNFVGRKFNLKGFLYLFNWSRKGLTTFGTAKQGIFAVVACFLAEGKSVFGCPHAFYGLLQ